MQPRSSIKPFDLIMGALGIAGIILIAKRLAEPNALDAKISRALDANEPDIAGPSADNHGRTANVPEEIPSHGLIDVFWRMIHEVSDERVTLIAAGVTFYLLLAIFPALAALVSLYGLIADPSTISEHLRDMAAFLPSGAFDIFANQLKALVDKRDSTLGLTFFIGLAIALWSTHNGTLAIFDAMNIAYGEREKRGLVKLNLIALLFTLSAMVASVVLITLVTIMPVILSYLWLDRWTETIALVARWPLLLVLVALAVFLIYRFGPSREPARARWITWGAALTTIGWFAMSLAFSFYLDHFANYNATYGTLGALIGFLIWVWLSIVILLIGAELNAELEHQTAKDTTTGTPRPIGTRGAYVADTLGAEQN